jgi:hypothetical protein
MDVDAERIVPDVRMVRSRFENGLNLSDVTCIYN